MSQSTTSVPKPQAIYTIEASGGTHDGQYVQGNSWKAWLNDWSSRDAEAEKDLTYDNGRWSVPGPNNGRWYMCRTQQGTAAPLDFNSVGD
ncbi:hypothetical protein PV04_08622 [Phialophora macrospora]|uniref:Uncharacterized protein n=1 Tax=Phialophora macrospora TaxID=1851006 RepID=A0A0D2DMS6_9EURO|nr:hypothetical protein PV04_08622 [Phialophora macrospora]